MAFVLAAVGTLWLARDVHDQRYRESVEVARSVLATEFPELRVFYDAPRLEERGRWGWSLRRAHVIDMWCDIEVEDTSNIVSLWMEQRIRGLVSDAFLVVTGLASASRHARGKYKELADSLRVALRERGLDVRVRMKWL